MIINKIIHKLCKVNINYKTNWDDNFINKIKLIYKDTFDRLISLKVSLYIIEDYINSGLISRNAQNEQYYNLIKFIDFIKIHIYNNTLDSEDAKKEISSFFTEDNFHLNVDENLISVNFGVKYFMDCLFMNINIFIPNLIDLICVISNYNKYSTLYDENRIIFYKKNMQYYALLNTINSRILFNNNISLKELEYKKRPENANDRFYFLMYLKDELELNIFNKNLFKNTYNANLPNCISFQENLFDKYDCKSEEELIENLVECNNFHWQFVINYMYDLVTKCIDTNNKVINNA